MNNRTLFVMNNMGMDMAMPMSMMCCVDFSKLLLVVDENDNHPCYYTA